MLDTADGKHQSALVWTVAERDAGGVLALSDRAFTHEVEKRMPIAEAVGRLLEGAPAKAVAGELLARPLTSEGPAA